MVCGAGIAGVSAGYYLSVVGGVDNVVIVDPRPPLTLTGDQSTECYRNWWPDPTMVTFMNRSIDLLEAMADESDDAFHLNRRGYRYLYGADQKPKPLGAEMVHREQLAKEYPYLGLWEYRRRVMEPVDGGYYTEATDGRPLIGPSGADIAYLCGGLSGYGVVAACAAGEPLAKWVVGGDLPEYAASFDASRYDNPAYRGLAAAGVDTGQL